MRISASPSVKRGVAPVRSAICPSKGTYSAAIFATSAASNTTRCTPNAPLACIRIRFGIQYAQCARGNILDDEREVDVGRRRRTPGDSLAIGPKARASAGSLQGQAAPRAGGDRRRQILRAQGIGEQNAAFVHWCHANPILTLIISRRQLQPLGDQLQITTVGEINEGIVGASTGVFTAEAHSETQRFVIRPSPAARSATAITAWSSRKSKFMGASFKHLPLSRLFSARQAILVSGFHFPIQQRAVESPKMRCLTFSRPWPSSSSR